MVVTLGQQYNIGEKPIVIEYIYINRHAGTPEKQRKQNSTSNVSRRRVHRVAVAARAGADDGGLRRKSSIWSGHIREQDGDHMHADSACTGNKDSLQRHGATVPPDNFLRKDVTQTSNLSEEIDRRIRTGWMSFKRHTRELYDRPEASLLPPKARIVRSEVVEALLYGCATWIPLNGHYTKLRTTHLRMLLRILTKEPGASRRTIVSSSTKTPSCEPNARASK